jgi:putative transposase
MARGPRIQVPSGTYHVTANACASRALFADHVDKSSFEALLTAVVERFDWSCLSYCLMTTHYHIMVTTPHADLAAGIQRLNGLYAQTYNRRHGGAGHVFHRRYHSEFIQTDAHLLATCRYIALNPVEAGLCARPADWPWSSYPETIGLKTPRPFLAVRAVLELFSDDPQLAISRLQTFTEEGLASAGHGEIRLAS